MILDEDDGATKPTDALSSPPAKRKAGTGDDARIDAELAAVLNQTELMVVSLHQSCGLSQRRGQALMDIGHGQTSAVQTRTFAKRHPVTIIHLLLRLEQPFKESPTTT